MPTLTHGPDAGPPADAPGGPGAPDDRGAPPRVAALLVSHDGARWLPTVLDGLARQRTPVERLVAVDTGSRDESATLLEAHGEVVRLDARTTFPAAVRAGLDRLAALAEPTEWIWLLHDDCTPDPDALAALLAAAREHPEADLLGPKLREWPSLRRLLEVGVTISGTGQRETGLERGEYDQGQHDEVREVLAVHSAGLLVRRETLEALGGLDPALPVFGNDLDLGWRAAAAGLTTLVVPQAVVFHAEAAHRGVRRTPLTGRHTHYQERRAALYTLLANSSTRALPWRVVRLSVGTLLRMVGLVLVRAPGEALDDLAALVSVLGRPGEVRAGRRARREALERLHGPGARPDAERVARLLAPPWLPYRHGLDAVSDVAAAVTNQAADVAERRRLAAAERDPSSMAARRVVAEDDDEALTDSGLVARLLTNPVALGLVAVVLALVVAARVALGPVSGGALSPAPASAGDWWSLYLHTKHSLAQGTPVPAPPLVLPLAALASLLGPVGPVGTVSLVLVLAAPVALWGAWRFLRVAGRLASPRGAARWLLLAGATSYAVVPFTSGAFAGGRLGVVVAAALLPWLAHAALGFADPDPDRRWRAAWRTALLLALVTGFAPVAWFLGVALGLVVLAAAAVLVPSLRRTPSAWGPPTAALAAVPVLLAPWWVPLLVHGAGLGLVLDTGANTGGQPTEGAALLLGRLGALGVEGAPVWLGAVLLAAALLALVPRATRPGVLVAWLVALVAALVAVVLAALPLDLAGSPAPVGLGVLLVAWQACLVCAAVLGAQGVLERGTAGRGAAGRGAGRPVVAGVALLAAVVPVGGLLWSVLTTSPLREEPDSDVPAYMVQSALTGPEHGILVVRGSIEDGLTYAVLRGDGVTLGEDEVLDLTAPDADLEREVQALVSRPRPAVASALAASGLEYVVLPAPADGRVAAGLDATAGLVQASAEERTTRAWRVDRPLDPDAVDGPGSWWRVALLVGQVVAVLTVLVLAAPTTREARR